MNTDELEAALYWAERRVLEIQAKLHRWAIGDRERRFDDLFNLVTDPAFLLVAWDRVRGNRGARTAGVDGHTAMSIALGTGVEEFLDALRGSLKQQGGAQSRFGWSWAGFRLLAQAEDGEQERRVVADLP